MENTAISWADHTWNPWTGCESVSPGCDHCYARSLWERFGRDFSTIRRAAPATFRSPLRWREPARVFTCSVSDFFHNDADAWRSDAWKMIRDTPHLTYMILTKRHGRIERSLPQDWGNKGYPNVWLGVSAEDQQWADRRLPVLLRIPAAVHFLSAEPLLGPINLERVNATRSIPPGYSFARLDALRGFLGDHFTGLYSRLDWVIAGGESGPGHRPMALEWARSLRDQCEEADVAFWFKQSGGPRPETGRELDGRRWEQLPTDCLHPDADGTGNPDEWECQACGLIWHEVEDPAGPISGGNGLHWRREVVRPAWRPGIRRILA